MSTTATLTLRVADQGGLDGLQMDVDYHGDFDPTSVAHNTIGYLAGMLIEQSDNSRKASAPTLILPEGATSV